MLPSRGVGIGMAATTCTPIILHPTLYSDFLMVGIFFGQAVLLSWMAPKRFLDDISMIHVWGAHRLKILIISCVFVYFGACRGSRVWAMRNSLPQHQQNLQFFRLTPEPSFASAGLWMGMWGKGGSANPCRFFGAGRLKTMVIFCVADPGAEFQAGLRASLIQGV